MGTTTNQSVRRGSDVRLNCYAQYYSEKVHRKRFVCSRTCFSLLVSKAMDSPYLPKILWYFERHQIFQRGNDVRRRSNVGTRCILSEDKYILGVDSLIIRNFTYYDQGVYYCRAFITLRNDLLTKINPVLVQLHGNSARVHRAFPMLISSFRSTFVARQRHLAVVRRR